MNFDYLCPHYIAQFEGSEMEALSFWVETMRRGSKAYSECRMEAAVTYLTTALEVGLLRSHTPLNHYFSPLHTIKPVEFLLETYVAEDDRQGAVRLIQKVTSHLGPRVKLEKQLAQLFEKYSYLIAEAENDNQAKKVYYLKDYGGL